MALLCAQLRAQGRITRALHAEDYLLPIGTFDK